MTRAAACLLILLVLLRCSGEGGADPTPGEILMAARIYAASQSDLSGDDTHWCETGADPEQLAAEGHVDSLPAGRYRVTGCIVGTFAGRRMARRFVAIVKHVRIHVDVRELPILSFQWL